MQTKIAAKVLKDGDLVEVKGDCKNFKIKLDSVFKIKYTISVYGQICPINKICLIL